MFLNNKCINNTEIDDLIKSKLFFNDINEKVKNKILLQVWIFLIQFCLWDENLQNWTFIANDNQKWTK